MFLDPIFFFDPFFLKLALAGFLEKKGLGLKQTKVPIPNLGLE